MITDKEIDQICTELKKWVKDRNTPKVSNTTAPPQTTYSTCQSYQYTIKCPPSISDWMKESPYSKLAEIIKRMEDTAKGLMDIGVTNFGLSLKSEIDDLLKLLWGVKE